MCFARQSENIIFPLYARLPHILRYEKKAVFGFALQGGRGVFSDRRKGKIPFQTLKMLIIGVLPFLVLNFCGLSKKHARNGRFSVFYSGENQAHFCRKTTI